MNRQSSANSQHQPNGFIRLCQWLWQKHSFFWSTIIIGIVINFVSTWLLQSQTADYGNSPFGLALYWVSQHVILVLYIGLMLLLIDIIIYLGNRRAVDFDTSNKLTPATSLEIIAPDQASMLDVMIPTGMPLIQLTDRVAQLERIKRVLRYEESGGVCVITGLNGVGKTVLAAKAVNELSKDASIFPGGALWIRCENLKGDEGFNELCLRIARRLRIDLVGKDAKYESLEQMQDKLSHALAVRPRTLLTLDNLEPELDIDKVMKTLEIPGHTSLLITTLRSIDAETDDQFILEPLKPQDATLYYKEQLHSRDSLRPNEDDWRILPALVEALGGLPLAIKLTAAYATYQNCSLEQILKEVQEDGLQKAGLKGLRKRFERLYQILPEQQRYLFAGLALLTGSTFPREAVKVIIQQLALTNVSQLYPDEDIDALITAALVELVGEARLRLHPLLRQYATEQLRKLPFEIQESMGDAVLNFWCNHANAHSHKAGELVREAEGLMGTITWAHEHKRHRDLLSLVRILSKPWEGSGRLIEVAQLYRWAVEAAETLNDLLAQYWSTFKLARNDACLGKITASSASFQQAFNLAVQLYDLGGQQQVIYEIAVIDELQGHLEKAQAGFKQVLELAKKLHGTKESIKAECNAIHGLSRSASKQAERLLHDANDFEGADKSKSLRLQAMQKIKEAGEGFRQELELAKLLKERLESIETERRARHELARLDELQENLKEAHEGFEQALALSHKLEDRFYISTDQRHLGFIIGRQGDLEKGTDMIKDALKYFVQSGDLYASGLCYLRLAELEKDTIPRRDSDQRKQVISYLREALWRFEHFHSPRAYAVRKELYKLEDQGHIENTR